MSSQPSVEKQLTLLPAGADPKEDAKKAGSPEECLEAQPGETGNEDRDRKSVV